ncbi:MAG TPA: hypothetical protein VNA25_07025 [Phycisphaerae bacterium]|nr:hypothetical protein [Phycisphaerae bacterium]
MKGDIKAMATGDVARIVASIVGVGIPLLQWRIDVRRRRFAREREELLVYIQSGIRDCSLTLEEVQEWIDNNVILRRRITAVDALKEVQRRLATSYWGKDPEKAEIESKLRVLIEAAKSRPVRKVVIGPAAMVPPSVALKRLFAAFWIYNMLVGFVPTVFPSLLVQYHWGVFAVGLIALSLALNWPAGRR